MNEMTQTQDIPALMHTIGLDAQAAGRALALASTAAKNLALREGAKAIRARKAEIIDANNTDVIAGKAKGLTPALIDRLVLNDERIESMAAGLEAIAELADPVGRVLSEWDRPNGLKIRRVAVPLGVIGVIYESRPNVTADAGALCLKAGNAVILRGGSESFLSSGVIHSCLVDGLKAANLPAQAIQRVPTRDRAAVGEMLTMVGLIDVIVPRGGKSLIERVTAESKVPLFKHLEGICHTYVDKSADVVKARAVVLNAKMRRTGVCGATETLLVDKAAGVGVLKDLVTDLLDAGCEVRGDAATQAVDERVFPAKDNDWDTEYLDAIISVKVVDGVADAMAHIAAHSSGHTESIIAEDQATADTFLNTVDSAIVMHNASTQFADGGEFGMGAEIGISTDKMHARGPVGVEQLTSFKYQVIGTGQTRPS
ncbi:glutamate-5-semialdehyde dehydrogenase [Magnetovibrio blakemorei]|uniref:Gamma-glutamyl phosphate reductase n=1 Tax=Magnetovibrio blakemorei TaxID=28181 RepID=A0A1E5Q7I8_9PROT|nr:glutamate-5-semialdehyde dehydrogenase [Magnetovibrio blakemorei]OEJ67071.1 glutamate-5-semialdehyde dehydrogenase [Magnetovibrio blakemorei]